MIDLSDHSEDEIGDEVTLFRGGATSDVEETAQLLVTIPKVTCAVSRRVPILCIKKLKSVEVQDYLFA